MSRYRTRSGIVVRRAVTTGGDVVLTLLTPEGKLRAVARAGLRGPRASKLSLFAHLTLQTYEKPGNAMPSITELILEGALVDLANPRSYAFAHLIAELADALWQENDHLGQAGFELFTGALRGLVRHHDPDHVALVFAWKLIAQAGIFPRLGRCLETGHDTNLTRFDPVAGGALHESTNHGLPIGEAALLALQDMTRNTVRELLDHELPPSTRGALWRSLEAYCLAHVGEIKAFAGLKEARVNLA